MNTLLLYRPTSRPRRKSVRLPATNHGARFQAKHPAPDGAWPGEPPPWWRSERAQDVVAKLALAVIVVSTVLMWVGCAHRPAPTGVEVARVQSYAIRCTPLICAKHIVGDCEDKGGMRNWWIVEVPYFGGGIPRTLEVSCEGRCWGTGDTVVSHDCVADPPDWRVAEVR